MTTDDRIALWGCIVCSSVWSASADGALDFAVSAVWLIFAGGIQYVCRERAMKEAP